MTATTLASLCVSPFARVSLSFCVLPSIVCVSLLAALAVVNILRVGTLSCVLPSWLTSLDLTLPPRCPLCSGYSAFCCRLLSRLVLLRVLRLRLLPSSLHFTATETYSQVSDCDNIYIYGLHFAMLVLKAKAWPEILNAMEARRLPSRAGAFQHPKHKQFMCVWHAMLLHNCSK